MTTMLSKTAIIAVSAPQDLRELSKTVASLEKQIFAQWKILVVGENPELIKSAVEVVPQERLIKEDKINLNNHLFILPILAGDLLTPDALAEIAAAFQAAPASTMIYADELERFGDTIRPTPFFKPDWSPEFALVTNYVGRAAYRRIGSTLEVLRTGFDLVSLWKITLSYIGSSHDEVFHIPRVLFFTSSLSRSDVADIAPRCLNLLDSHLAHNGIKGEVYWPEWAQRLPALTFDFKFPDDGPSVAIIIPTKNNYDVLRRCVSSIALTSYRNYRLVVIDNDSNDRETLEYLSTLGDSVVRIKSRVEGFNYSYLNNEAVKLVSEEFVLFLNDDTEVINPQWLSSMVGLMQFNGVASVGARLIFPDGRIQHAGLVHRLLDEVLPAPAFKLMPSELMGPHAQDRTIRNYSALTAACLLTKRDLFILEGGFDELNFGVAYNDVDYGFRLSLKGLRHVYSPQAELYHYEGATRGRGAGNDKISEEIFFIEKYRDFNDRYFNANLSRDSFEFTPSATAIPASASTAPVPMSVALIAHNLNFEGASLVLLDIARGLMQEEGFSVVVVSLVDGPLRIRFEEVGCIVVVLDKMDIIAAKSRTDIISVLSPIRQLYRDFEVDVVMANTVLSYWANTAAVEEGIPCLWFIHESEPPFSHLSVWEGEHVALAKAAFLKTFANIFCCRATSSIYARYLEIDNRCVLYNGFDAETADQFLTTHVRQDTREHYGINDNDFVLITPGTVCERKSQIDLIEAACLLPEADLQKATFVIVGDRDNDYSRNFHARLSEAPSAVRSRFIIVGETEQIWRYYAMADALVFPSKMESFPRAIQEGMYCGIPIVSTPVFGISEQLRNGESGLLFGPGNFQEMAICISRVLNDVPLRAKLGQNAKLSLRRFPTLAEMQSSHVELIKRAGLSTRRTNDGKSAFETWLRIVDDPKGWQADMFETF